MERDELVLRITEQIAAGTLPCEDCVVTWWGQGRGRPCAACHQTIRPIDIETECDLPGGGTIYFHRACYLLWRGALPRLPT
jgi:hypothetical protein